MSRVDPAEAYRKTGKLRISLEGVALLEWPINHDNAIGLRDALERLHFAAQRQAAAPLTEGAHTTIEALIAAIYHQTEDLNG